MGARFTIQNYIDMLVSLLPPGKAWSRESESVLYKLLSGFAPELVRIEEQARKLIDEARPLTATETIEEWEEEQGFPDTYYDIPEELEARRQQVAGRMYFSGEERIPNKAFWIEQALRLGYTITSIDDEVETDPFEVGRSAVGNPIGAGLWESSVVLYVDCQKAAGKKLEGIFNKLKHSHLTFVYIYLQ